MTDMRRTLLWVVFTMSLVLLWDAWNRHTGQPTMFGSPTRPATVAEGGTWPRAGAVPPRLPVPAPAAAAVPAAHGHAGRRPVPTASTPPVSEQVTVTTDRVKASFDSIGGSLVRLELLAHRDNNDPTRNVLLFEQSAKRLYVAQTGLVTSTAGCALPNHFTAMTAVPGERTLAEGADELSLRFESPVIDGVKLAKTYTFKRGEYTVAVRHEVINQGAAAISPQLYLQLARDGNPPEGESSFYFTFTGPALYTEAKKFQKIEFKDIADGDTSHEKSANDGWIAMVQHYFASAWLVDARPARVPHRQGRRQPLHDGHGAAAGRGGPGRQQGARRRAVCRPAGGEQARRAGAGPGARQGLRLVHRAGQAAVLAARQAALRDRQLGLGHRRAGGGAEDRLLLAQLQRLQAAWPR
jgi:YidC/Oxa1 family membrane protein insertase